jgi:hypothetical protein
MYLKKFHFAVFLTFSTPNGIIEGKIQWLSGLLSKYLGKSGQNSENTDGLAALN